MMPYGQIVSQGEADKSHWGSSREADQPSAREPNEGSYQVLLNPRGELMCAQATLKVSNKNGRAS